MGKISIELNVPDEILKTIDIERLKRMGEREIIIEHSVQKLHGKFRDLASACENEGISLSQ